MTIAEARKFRYRDQHYLQANGFGFTKVEIHQLERFDDGFQATIYKRRTRKHKLYGNYRYGAAERVVKVPRLRGKWRRLFPFLKRANTFAEEAPQLLRAQKYFGPRLADTELREGKNGGYVEVQRFLHHARHIRPSDINTNSAIRAGVWDVLERNANAIKNGDGSIGFLGKKGAKSVWIKMLSLGLLGKEPYMTNVNAETNDIVFSYYNTHQHRPQEAIVLQGTTNARVIDYDFLDLDKWRDRLSYTFNRLALRHYFFRNDKARFDTYMPKLKNVPQK